MSSKSTLVIDSNNALARNAHVFTDAYNDRGEPIGALFGMLMNVHRFLVENPDHDSVVFCVDDGVPPWRKELCPEYKAQREAARSEADEAIHAAYKAQVPHVRPLTRWLGCGHAVAEGFEGDDVVAALVLRRYPDRRFTIMSSDKDFIELVDDRVRLYDGIGRQWREPSDTYLLERCLDPKSSDNLDGPAGVGEVAAARVADAFRIARQGLDEAGAAPFAWHSRRALDTMLCMCREVAAIPDAETKTMDKEAKALRKACQRVVPFEDKVVKNWQVTCLHRVAKACDAGMRVRLSAYDPARFQETVRYYGLRPVLQDMQAYRNVFGRLDHAWMRQDQVVA